MSYNRVFETISVEHPEIDISELAAGGAGITRKNARKHGVTAELEPRSVRDWYRIIVNNPNATMPLFDTPNDMQKLALMLAQAEVRLRRVLETIAEFKQDRDPLFEKRANLIHGFQLYLRFARNRGLDKWMRDSSKILMRIAAKDLRALERQIKARVRLLERYKREALSKQRKAQKAWCDKLKMD